MRYTAILATAAACLSAPLPALARSDSRPDEMVEIKAGTTPAISPAKAYLLFRVPDFVGVRSVEPIFLRIPSADELARYEAAKRAAYEEALPDLTENYHKSLESFAERRAEGKARPGDEPVEPSFETFNFVWDEVQNLQDVDHGDAFEKGDDQRTYLVETPPGKYVLYGMTYSMGLPVLNVCFCLGSVGFEAKAGQVTDLGYLYGDYHRQTPRVPELTDQPGNMSSLDFDITGTVRPARADSRIPQALGASTVVPANYEAVGRFFTPNAGGISRLVPVPGILSYDHGKVIDARTGEVVPDNF